MDRCISSRFGCCSSYQLKIKRMETATETQADSDIDKVESSCQKYILENYVEIGHGDGEIRVAEIESVLPPEILTIILSYFQTQELVSQNSWVCRRWNIIAKQIILKRVQNLETNSMAQSIKNLRSLVKYCPPPVPKLRDNTAADEVDETTKTIMDLSDELYAHLCTVRALILFEKLQIKPGYEIHLHSEKVGGESTSSSLPTDNPSESQEMLESIANLTFDDNKFDIVKFMSCWNLIICNGIQEFRFFALHEDDNTKETTEVEIPTKPNSNSSRHFHSKSECLDYKPHFKKIVRGDTGHEYLLKTKHLSISGNNILINGDTSRSLAWIQVRDVCHRIAKVLLSRERLIYTPFYIQDFILYNDKLYILYEPNPNRFVGLWIRETEELLLSEESLSTDNNWKLRRVNNFIFLMPCEIPENEENDADNDDNNAMADGDEEEEEELDVNALDMDERPRDLAWMILDGNTKELKFHPVQMNNIVRELYQDACDYFFDKVVDIAAFGNLFIATCVFEGTMDMPGRPAPKLIVLGVMKRDPKLEDFASREAFQALFHTDMSQTISFDGFLSSPFVFNDYIYMVGQDETESKCLFKVCKFPITPKTPVEELYTIYEVI